MNSTTIQFWPDSYFCVALLVAVVAAVAADHFRAGDPPALAVSVATVSLAGALWPLMLAGLLQWWALTTLISRVRQTPVPERPTPRLLAGAGSH